MTEHSTATGELLRAGDRWNLRFIRSLRWPPSGVWHAVTSAEGLAAWFPQRIEGSWEVGAPLRFADDSGAIVFEGRVLAFEPERLVEFEWGTDVIRIELAPAAGGTTLTLTQAFEEQGKAARDGAGWHLCLDLLEATLSPAGARPEPAGNWEELFEQYRHRLGGDASRIGPPDTSSVGVRAR